MHSSSDENGRNGGSSFDVSHRTQDQARVVNAGRNAGGRNVALLSGSAGSRSGNERVVSKIQGLLMDVNGVLGQNFSQKALEPLLNKVNLVLNKDFQHKTLIAAVEFDLFFEEVFSNHGEPNVRDSELIDFLRKANMGDAQAQSSVDDVLRFLFFYCGGTLVGDLKTREERRAERDIYLSKRPSVKKEYIEYVEKKGLNSDVPYIIDDRDGVGGNVASSTSVPCGSVAFCGDNVSEDTLSESSDALNIPAPWADAVLKTKREARRYFDDISCLEADDLSVLRRLLYLSWGDVSTESLGVDLMRPIADAVEAVFDASSSFDLETLSAFYESLCEGTSLRDIDEFVFDAITAYALTCVERLMRPDNEVGEIDSHSDFSSAYPVIARLVISKDYDGKPIDVDDCSATDSFYKSFVKEIGDPKLVSKLELERILLRTEGVFTPESIHKRRSIKELSRPDFIRRILCEEYPQGLNITSASELEGFRKWGRHYDVESLEKEDQALRSDICRYAIVVDGFAYSVPESVKSKIKQAVTVFMNYGHIVYYEDFFKKNEASIMLQDNVVNWRVLRTLLAGCFKEYTFYEYYLEKVASDTGKGSSGISESLKIRKEIKKFWGDLSAARSVEEITSKVYIPLERVLYVLNNDRTFESIGNDLFQAGADFQDSVSIEKGFAERFKSEEADLKWGVDGKELASSLKERCKRLYVDGGPLQPSGSTTESIPLSLLNKERVVENDGIKINQKQEATPVPSHTEIVRGEDEKGSNIIEKDAPKVRLSREKLNVFAKALAVNYKSGLDLTDKQELLNFRTKVEELGKFAVPESDEDLADVLQHRIGFLCDGRVYIVSKKTKEVVMDRVDGWFAGGGRLIYYSSLFERLNKELEESEISPIPSKEVLINRLKKYYPDYAFSEDYFEAKEDRVHDLDEKLIEEICQSGRLKDSSKRLEELAGVLFIPKEIIDQTLSDLSKDNTGPFQRSSNGYWRWKREEEGLRRGASVKRRASRRPSSSN
ncbi:MAG: hypothetical protein ACI4NP_04450 [Thermoguttaceae bacterium]